MNKPSCVKQKLLLCLSAAVLACGTTGCTLQQVAAVEKAATPTFSPAGGTYTSPQSVTLSDIVPGVPIYYTTDGSMKPTSLTLYTGPIAVNSSTTLYAVAAADGYYSDPGSAAYTLQIAPAPAPSIAPNGGSFSSAQTVTLNDTLATATIYYTLDGSLPSTSSTVYSKPFTVAQSGATTVKAIAVAPYYPNSSVASATFTITYPVSTHPTTPSKMCR